MNPAVEVNARFSPLVVKIQLYVCARACACIKYRHTYILCMSEGRDKVESESKSKKD